MGSDYIANFNEQCLLPLSDNYYNAEIGGDYSFFHDIGKRPIIFVGNHAGACLSWDNMIFDALLWRETNRLFEKPIKLTRLIHPSLYNNNVSPFLIKDWWRKMNCEPCTLEVFDRKCHENSILYISPEGINGLAKGYKNRNRLLNFSSSFVMMAKKHNALVVPVSIKNSEYLNPFSISIRCTNKLFKYLFGLPFFPLAPCTLTLIIPKYFIASLPAKMNYKILKPIELASRTPNNYVCNQFDSDLIRELIQKDISENSDSLPKGVNYKKFFRHVFFGKDERSVSKHYRLFWETHLGRNLRLYERLLFHVPIFGYFLVNKFINKDQLYVRN